MLDKDIDKVTAGRELDLMIAELLEPKPELNHKDDHLMSVVYSPLQCWFCLPEFKKGDVCEWEPVHLSTDLGRVGLLLSKIDVAYQLFHGPTTGWTIMTHSGKDRDIFIRESKDLNLALCKFILLLLGQHDNNETVKAPEA